MTPLRHRSRIGRNLVAAAALAAAGSFAWAQGKPPTVGAGEAAEPARLAAQALVLDAVVISDGPARRIVAVGDRGHILVSQGNAPDATLRAAVPPGALGAPHVTPRAAVPPGAWRQVAVPANVLLTAIAAPDATSLWAVGHDAVILHSADRGETWVKQYSAPDAQATLLDAWFESATTGWAVGAYGLALRTGDGGKTWEKREIDDQERHLYALTPAADGALYVAGESGALFRSADKGETWDELESPYKGSYFGLVALREGPLLAFGMRGQLYRSADQGKSWRPIQTKTTASLTAGRQAADGRVVIVGLGGTVLVSADGGQSFATANRPGRRAYAGLIEAQPGQFLALGESGPEPLEAPK
jgi:photosystem II stability/assembly factor-like uncharacterized protein